MEDGSIKDIDYKDAFELGEDKQIRLKKGTGEQVNF